MADTPSPVQVSFRDTLPTAKEARAAALAVIKAFELEKAPIFAYALTTIKEAMVTGALTVDLDLTSYPKTHVDALAQRLVKDGHTVTIQGGRFSVAW